MIVKRTRRILEKYQLKIHKSFGQNFLIDENILRKIVQESKTDKETGVIEIGPGIGALTEFLLLASKKVLAFEIDENLVKVLGSELAEYDNFKLVNKDFLKVNLQRDLSYLDDCKRVIVVSNLPYYITTPIIFKFLETENRIQEYYFMMQKEVGERLTSNPNSKDYGSLTVLVKYKTETKIVITVSKNSFFPKPNVDSVVLSLKRREIDLGINNEADFQKFIRVSFSQRRKTLVNNIITSYDIKREDLESNLSILGIDHRIRSEALDLLSLAKIYKLIFEAPK
jgi:16S rRNA (adenine1518-N6/adenine1519-N6)-dimethyltransferase